MTSPAEVACRVCGERVPRDAMRCPSCECKHPDAVAFRRATRTPTWPWILLALVALAIWRALRGP